jgi:hypothetical protein
VTSPTYYIAGQTAALMSRWYEYAGGPAQDLDANPSLRVIPLTGGAAVAGPTTGVGHPTTGTYTYAWATGATPAGQYLAIWSGTSGGTAVEASEVITLLAATSSATPFGPCEPWTPIWCANLTTAAQAATGTGLAAATEILYALSGRQFGLCAVELRPCRRDCAGGAIPAGWWEYGAWPRPALINGAWYNLGCGGCAGGCSCTTLEEAVLPGPVHDIVQVLVDGDVLDSSAYRLDNNRLLVRVDGGVWPACQNLAAATTETGTWAVTARFGQPVPVMGQLAVGELAAEFAKACVGDDDCALPKPVQQIARAGITMTFLDPNEVFAQGRIGLTNCDLFIQTVNPHGLQAAPQVYDVDGPTFRRTGT